MYAAGRRTRLERLLRQTSGIKLTVGSFVNHRPLRRLVRLAGPGKNCRLNSPCNVYVQRLNNDATYDHPIGPTSETNHSMKNINKQLYLALRRD